jgi:hypothetical protein
LREAQLVVGTSADFVSIVVVLSIVFPETNWTDLVPAPHVEGKKPTTRARIWLRPVNAYELRPDTVTSTFASL